MAPTPEMIAEAERLIAGGMDRMAAIRQVKAKSGGVSRQPGQEPALVPLPGTQLNPAQAAPGPQQVEPQQPFVERGFPSIPLSEVPARTAAIGQAAKEKGIEFGKQGVGEAAAGIAIGPFAATVPMLSKPVARLAEHGVFGNQGSSGEAVRRGAVEGGIEQGVNAVLGAIPAARMAAGSLAARIGEDKMASALGRFLERIATKEGSPEAIKAVASKWFDQAEKLAGDAPIPVDNFMSAVQKLQRTAQNPMGGGVSADIKQLIDSSQLMSQRPGGAHTNLAELGNAFRTWGERVKADPKNGAAKMIYRALSEDMRAAAESAGLSAPAAEAFAGARSIWKQGAQAADVEKLVIGSETVDRDFGPRKFAGKLLGTKWKAIQKGLADNPELLQGLTDARSVARVLAKKGKSWAPEWMSSPKAREMLDSFMDSRNVMKIFTTPELRAEFMQILQPRQAGVTADQALAIAGDFINKVGAGSEAQAAEPAQAELRALGGPAGSVDRATKNKQRAAERQRALRTKNQAFEGMRKVQL